MRTIHDEAVAELQTIEPKIDLLHEILGCGLFAEVTQTSDGFWLGREPGDCGFNAFLGKPSAAALNRTKTFITKMSEPVQQYVKTVLQNYQL